ncbi:MAG: M28 family peptidase [Candidatus Altiarchaeia archaeon]
MDRFKSILARANTPSRDNGRCFTESERLDNIKKILADSNYVPLKEGGLSYIYRHRGYETDKPAILISCHIDSVYAKYHHGNYNDADILGTFDNSICNAALLCLMTENRLPASVLVAFTGDEENECRGAKETSEHIRDKYPCIWRNLELVIVLDITSEGYDNCSFTLENFFIEKNPAENARLRFPSRDVFRDYLRGKLSRYENIKSIDADADPDESWEYDKYDLNCFTFCFPAGPHPDNGEKEASYWMHDDKGMLIKRENMTKYPDALSLLLQGIADDFKN